MDFKTSPNWCRKMLQVVAPTVETLGVWNVVRSQDLAELQKMPRLRRLQVVHGEKCLDFKLPPLEHGGGLEWLKVELPLDAVKSILITHRHSLRRLWLGVGTDGNRPFPYACDYRHLSFVLEEGLPVVESVVLWRDGRVNHSVTNCSEQKCSVWSILGRDSAVVLCSSCDLGLLPPGVL